MQEVQGNALAFARDTFEKAAAKYVAVLRPFSDELLPSGDKLAQLPVITREGNGPGFLLQYAVIGKVGHVAIITVEGAGSVQDAETALLPKVRTAKFKS